MRGVLAQFPGVRWVRVTAANYERRTLTVGLWPVENLDALAALPETDWLPARGGFLRDHAVKSVLVQNAAAWQRAIPTEPLFGLTPAVVVLRGSAVESIADDGLAHFAGLVPDADGYWERSIGGVLEACAWDGTRRTFSPFVPAGLHVFRSGNRLAACRVDSDQPTVAEFAGPNLSDDLEVFDPTSAMFSPVPEILPVAEVSRYARGVDAWQHDAAHRLAPGRSPHGLREIVRASRDSGVLVPSTSYIVVENSAQWRALERKETQRLNGRQNLDLMESPEPSTALVGLLAAAFLLRRRRKTVPAVLCTAALSDN
jgi:MYXO-CTERM domain-containing protein